MSSPYFTKSLKAYDKSEPSQQRTKKNIASLIEQIVRRGSPPQDFQGAEYNTPTLPTRRQPSRQISGILQREGTINTSRERERGRARSATPVTGPATQRQKKLETLRLPALTRLHAEFAVNSGSSAGREGYHDEMFSSRHLRGRSREPESMQGASSIADLIKKFNRLYEQNLDKSRKLDSLQKVNKRLAGKNADLTHELQLQQRNNKLLKLEIGKRDSRLQAITRKKTMPLAGRQRESVPNFARASSASLKILAENQKLLQKLRENHDLLMNHQSYLVREGRTLTRNNVASLSARERPAQSGSPVDAAIRRQRSHTVTNLRRKMELMKGRLTNLLPVLNRMSQHNRSVSILVSNE
jgi:hypothetical protein